MWKGKGGKHVIWVSCCSQNTAPKVKSHLMSQHSVSEVSPYEVLSVLSHQDLVFLEVKNAASEGFELRTNSERHKLLPFGYNSARIRWRLAT